MADPAPKRKRMPVGCGFRPTEQELIAHYLHHRLKADDPSIYTTIPEIDVCKYEPPDLLALAASAISLTEFDDSECYFFAPRDYKYSNSTRSNRATSRGFWKVTGRDRKIKDRDTNKVIGIQRILVFYEGRFPQGIKTSWVIHEYHDATFSLNQRTHVVCKLMKKYDKKTRKKISTDLKIQTPSQSNELQNL
ncbi:protein NTM1-like 9 [Prosopis cineraria]|uniref:protein NTM1-like 9 n=1 Tax=Prosopis cineraria TaxID=364024 RepID=UPI00240F21AF|nr:protein NTM1-like 9 [Prosopis cineraria]